MDVLDNAALDLGCFWICSSLGTIVWSSREFEGGVGGNPKSRPLTRTGYSNEDLGSKFEEIPLVKVAGVTGAPFEMMCSKSRLLGVLCAFMPFMPPFGGSAVAGPRNFGSGIFERWPTRRWKSSRAPEVEYEGKEAGGWLV